MKTCIITKVKLSIVSFNVFGAPFDPHRVLWSLLKTRIATRLTKISQILSEQNADVILLQELHSYKHLSLMRKILKEYPFVIYKRYLFGPRGGLVVFSKLPLKQLEYVDFRKKGAYFNKSITGHISKKGILLCKLDNYPVYLLNTHLTQNSDHDWSKSNRYSQYLLAQLQQLAEIVTFLTPSRNQIILGGDLNMPKDSMFYKQFLSRSNLVDLFSDYSSSTYHNDYFPDRKLNIGRIDYIFASYGCKLRAKDQIFTQKFKQQDGKISYLSDHKGLLAYITI